METAPWVSLQNLPYRSREGSAAALSPRQSLKPRWVGLKHFVRNCPPLAPPASGRGTRSPDRIETAPQYSESDAIRLNNMFRGRDTVEMLTILLRENMLGDAAIVSQLRRGKRGVIAPDRQHRSDPCPCCFWKRASIFPRHWRTATTLIAHIGMTDLRNITPDPALLARKDENGLRWSYDPDGCCDIRKVLPLKAALAPFDAQFTGRKAFQSKTRGALPRFEIEEGRLKVNPLADWDKARIAAYIAEHNLPPHPLGRTRLSLHRMQPMYDDGSPRRRRTLRPLERLGQGRMRDPYGGSGGRR